MLLVLKDAIGSGTIDQEKFEAANSMESKNHACETLSIYVAVNVQIGIEKQYYIGTPPKDIVLPIKAFCKLYEFPEGIEVMNDDDSGGGTDLVEFYKDKALIIISNQQPKSTIKIKAEGKQNWEEVSIEPQDNAPSSIVAPLKNIVVQISGSKQDVLAIVKQIDWKALSTLIGK
jgi:hypothetical protein